MADDSQILNKNLNNWIEGYEHILNKYGVKSSDLKNVCWNLHCKCYGKKLSVTELFDFAGNNSNKLPYLTTDNAHIAASSLCKDIRWKEEKNHHKNGIKLCQNCHHMFDRNGGHFNNIENANDKWTLHMLWVCNSKKEMIDFFKKAVEELYNYES